MLILRHIATVNEMKNATFIKYVWIKLYSKMITKDK